MYTSSERYSHLLMLFRCRKAKLHCKGSSKQWTQIVAHNIHKPMCEVGVLREKRIHMTHYSNLNKSCTNYDSIRGHNFWNRIFFNSESLVFVNRKLNPDSIDPIVGTIFRGLNFFLALHCFRFVQCACWKQSISKHHDAGMSHPSQWMTS